MRDQARAAGVSPATVFHVAWARVLAAAAGRDDVVFGTVLLGRMQSGAGADRLPGLLLNTLPVRVRVAGTGVARCPLRAMQAQLAALLAHEHAPLALAQKASAVPPQAPLFTCTFNYRHSPPPEQEHTQHRPGRHRAPVTSGSAPTIPLAVSVDDTGTGFTITVQAMAPADPGRVCALLRTATTGLASALETSWIRPPVARTPGA